MELFNNFKPTSEPNELDKKDWKRWARNFFIFSSPAILAILIALQGFITNENYLPTRPQITFALGAGYQAILASLIDLFQKYKTGK